MALEATNPRDRVSRHFAFSSGCRAGPPTRAEHLRRVVPAGHLTRPLRRVAPPPPKPCARPELGAGLLGDELGRSWSGYLGPTARTDRRFWCGLGVLVVRSGRSFGALLYRSSRGRGKGACGCHGRRTFEDSRAGAGNASRRGRGSGSRRDRGEPSRVELGDEFPRERLVLGGGSTGRACSICDR
jgi:hypothetical protein